MNKLTVLFRLFYLFFAMKNEIEIDFKHKIMNRISRFECIFMIKKLYKITEIK
jgi:hypothetical protein